MNKYSNKNIKNDYLARIKDEFKIKNPNPNNLKSSTTCIRIIPRKKSKNEKQNKNINYNNISYGNIKINNNNKAINKSMCIYKAKNNKSKIDKKEKYIPSGKIINKTKTIKEKFIKSYFEKNGINLFN